MYVSCDLAGYNVGKIIDRLVIFVILTIEPPT